LIPSQLLKIGIHASVGRRVTLGAEALSGGDFHLRGDEGNQVEKVDGYTVLNVRGELAFNDNVRLFLNIDNVLDAEYETFGLFGEADAVLGDDFDEPTFLSPASPRAAWVGVHVNF
jgi:outer membrane receptor protein involved in Fe transport